MLKEQTISKESKYILSIKLVTTKHIQQPVDLLTVKPSKQHCALPCSNQRRYLGKIAVAIDFEDEIVC